MFTTVLADPPWPYQSDKAIIKTLLADGSGVATGVDAATKYPLMSIDELKDMGVQHLLNENAHLYLWTTNSFMVEAHEVARAWGFEPKTIITWVKVKRGEDTPSMKTGTYYRSATEHILFGVRGRLRLNGPCRPTVLYAERLPHSVKPEESYQLIEEQSPARYLELFARRKRKGWTQHGNQLA